ncbi:MAG TPA: hypothetical protein VFO73_05630 [Candidatus Limnocylindrales bacterium]|nr:hypothetical protein [Candidatus Limnocylindrales bacterium]
MTGAGVFELLSTLARRPATTGVFGLWAVAEAIVLPIVPDVGLCLLVLAAPRQVLRLLAAVVFGAVIGTLMLAILIDRAPDTTRTLLRSLPGIDGAVIADAEGQLSREGVAGFAQVGIGPPLKVYTSAWLGQGGGVPGIVAGAILNRVTRIGATVVVAALAGAWLGAGLRRHAWVTLSAYALFWIAVYVSIWT